MDEARKIERKTYKDWFNVPENIRRELIDGQIIMMASPSVRHQRVLGNLFAEIHGFLKGRRCEVFPAPFAVRLSDDVFEPDITVVCDPKKLGKYVCKGAPDLIIEILSSSNRKHDTWVKYNKYMLAGVPEYWVADTDSNTVDVNLLRDGTYSARTYGGDDTIPVGVLPGCEINIEEIMRE
ncbi:hypothetical protein FACS1894202_03320 [Clostridia bacterium]|nr:hypothetical protein FACS1894202_03320 [Clostridia bacterium]